MGYEPLFGMSHEIASQLILHDLVEGSLETKAPTIWTDKKHSQEEAEPGRNSDAKKVRRETIRDRESQKREDAGARKGREVAKDCVFSNDLWLWRRVEK